MHDRILNPVSTLHHTRHTACDVAHSLIAGQVGRTRSITLSQTTPAASASTTSTPLPDGAKDNNKRDDEDSAKLVVRESFADKARDAAATATASLVQATSAAAHGSALGGGGTMEGRWDEETFLLPLPDGDDTLLAAHAESDDGDNLDTEKGGGASVSRVLGVYAQGSGDEDNDTAGRESSSVSIDDGVHLRVEVWQGKHCHGQVDCVACGVIYLRRQTRQTAR